MVKKTFNKDQEFQAAFKQNLDLNVKNLTKQIAKKCGYSDEEITKALEGEEVQDQKNESKLYEENVTKEQGQYTLVQDQISQNKGQKIQGQKTQGQQDKEKKRRS